MPLRSFDSQTGASSPEGFSTGESSVNQNQTELANYFRRQIDQLKDETRKELSELKNEFIKRNQLTIAKSTETLAVFVALFTLISISFSFFEKKLSMPLIIGLLLVLGGILLLFLLLLHYMIHFKSSDELITYKDIQNASLRDYFKMFLTKLGFAVINNMTATFVLIVSIGMLAFGVLITNQHKDQQVNHEIIQNTTVNQSSTSNETNNVNQTSTKIDNTQITPTQP